MTMQRGNVRIRKALYTSVSVGAKPRGRRAVSGLLVLLAATLGASEPRWIELTPVPPVTVENRGAEYFVDFGRARYGTLELTGSVDRERNVTVRIGEKLVGSGHIDRKPPGSVAYQEITLRVVPGKKVHRLEIPEQEVHRLTGGVRPPEGIGRIAPFRYAEIEGWTNSLDAGAIRQLAAAAAFDVRAAAFSSSDATLNAIWDLCKHTVHATTPFGLYIDGDRERLPYEADAYINQLSHYACDLDPRVARATIDFLVKRPTWPTEWGFHLIMMVAADYEATGNLEQAGRYYDVLRQKLRLDRAREDGLLVAPAIVDWPPSERDGFDGAPSPENRSMVGPAVNAPVNAFHFHALQCMAQLAKALGRTADAEEFAARAHRVHVAFNTKLFDAGQGAYVDGEGTTHASIHANLFPLAFGLVPPQRVAGVAAHLRARGMACSVYAAQYLLEGLYRAGLADHALALMTDHGPRSWWAMMAAGSTMTTEAWNETVKPNLTWNHAWGAAPANIITRFLLGVRPLAPGYREILIAPQPAGLAWANGKVPTPLGPVIVDFARNASLVTLHVTIPAGARARLECLPEWQPRGLLRLNGRAVDASALAALGAGTHLIELR